MISVTEALILVAVILFIWVLLKPEVLVRWGKTLGRLRAEVSRGESEDEVFKIAERLGIPTDGKTREELIEAIRARAKRSEST
ncbi:MAG: hypothetical protein NZ957_05435 [Thaumarchaeota archaeon]|nr:hypothetical protein [Candidatus Calditenuaceae archaeon]MDW8041520.1 hypothetical protein [Nitrososphaerota archaeon]